MEQPALLIAHRAAFRQNREQQAARERSVMRQHPADLIDIGAGRQHTQNRQGARLSVEQEVTFTQLRTVVQHIPRAPGLRRRPGHRVGVRPPVRKHREQVRRDQEAFRAWRPARGLRGQVHELPFFFAVCPPRDDGLAIRTADQERLSVEVRNVMERQRAFADHHAFPFSLPRRNVVADLLGLLGPLLLLFLALVVLRHGCRFRDIELVVDHPERAQLAAFGLVLFEELLFLRVEAEDLRGLLARGQGDVEFAIKGREVEDASDALLRLPEPDVRGLAGRSALHPVAFTESGVERKHPHESETERPHTDLHQSAQRWYFRHSSRRNVMSSIVLVGSPPIPKRTLSPGAASSNI